MISEEQLDKALEYLRETARAAATARSQARTLKKYLDVVEAQQKVIHKDLTNAAARDEARASPEYKTALDAYSAAVERDCEFTMLREAASSRIEAWRTQQANARAEGKAYS